MGRPVKDVELHTVDASTLLRSLPSGSVDAVITDPPYSSGGAFRGDRTRSTSKKYVGNDVTLERPEFLGDTRDQRGYLAWCTLWLTEALRVAKDGAPICVFTDWRQLPTMTDALQAGGWVHRGIAVWDKTEAVRPVPGRLRCQAEFIVWGSKGPMPVARRCPVLPGVFRHPSKGRRKLHIASKPVPVMRWLAKFCEPGGLILDPFAGSGTTGVAALAEGRRFLGAELSPEIAAIALQRLERGEDDDSEEDSSGPRGASRGHDGADARGAPEGEA